MSNIHNMGYIWRLIFALSWTVTVWGQYPRYGVRVWGFRAWSWGVGVLRFGVEHRRLRPRGLRVEGFGVYRV